MKSLKGSLILDNGKLAGSAFHRTVVLICEHDANGAFGLVLNRHLGHTVGEALDAVVPEEVERLPLFWGGPVQPQALSYLIRGTTTAGTNVMPGLRLSHSLEELEPLGTSVQFKFFAGYAGWGPGQLDNEMKHEAWLAVPATLELVFHPQPEALWKLILRTQSLEYRLLAEAPDNISWN